MVAMAAPSSSPPQPQSLPKIDISPFLPSSTPVDVEARRRCAEDIYTACTTTGFFYLVGHGIPTETLHEVLEQGRDFFLNSTTEQKEAIVRQKVGQGNGDGVRGWQPVRDNVTKGKRDWQEAVDFYGAASDIDAAKAAAGPPYDILMGDNLWPSHPPTLRETYDAYIERVLQLGEAVLTGMGAALGPGNEELFVRQTRRSFWGMRLIGYSPIPADERQNDDGGISCGEHTDYGCCTLLLADGTKGALQVKTSDDQWINADPVPGAFVVNIGDMMERWTNGLWKSTTHRVVHRGDGFRVSVPFFYEPDFAARIKPLQTCVDRTGGVVQYKEVIYGDHLLSKISKNFYSGVGAVPFPVFATEQPQQPQTTAITAAPVASTPLQVHLPQAVQV